MPEPAGYAAPDDFGLRGCKALYTLLRCTIPVKYKDGNGQIGALNRLGVEFASLMAAQIAFNSGDSIQTKFAACRTQTQQFGIGLNRRIIRTRHWRHQPAVERKAEHDIGQREIRAGGIRAGPGQLAVEDAHVTVPLRDAVLDLESITMRRAAR